MVFILYDKTTIMKLVYLLNNVLDRGNDHENEIGIMLIAVISAKDQQMCAKLLSLLWISI